MRSPEYLKDSKILVLHGRSQDVSDLLQPLASQFLNIATASSASALPPFPHDLIVVNYAVSDMTGVLLYNELKKSPSWGLIPAIFVADTKSYDHRLNAFEIGAADFISRSLDSVEFLRKCYLHLQNRRLILEDQSIQIGNLILYPHSETVVISGQPVSLTRLEYKILHFILSTPRQVVLRSEIYENVWGTNFINSGRLDTQLYNLKKKLANFNGKIKSVNKVGMRILITESTFSQKQKTAGSLLQSPERRP